MAEIHGMREALETLKQLPEHIAPRGGGPINSSLFKAADIWRKQVETNAANLGPGVHNKRTGPHRLKNNIIRARDSEPERDGFYARVFVGYRARVFWGAFVENGTEKQRAQPFLRPTLDQAGDRPITVFAESLRKDIERITNRLRAR